MLGHYSRIPGKSLVWQATAGRALKRGRKNIVAMIYHSGTSRAPLMPFQTRPTLAAASLWGGGDLSLPPNHNCPTTRALPVVPTTTALPYRHVCRYCPHRRLMAYHTMPYTHARMCAHTPLLPYPLQYGLGISCEN
jgi:hypothetical protein